MGGIFTKECPQCPPVQSCPQCRDCSKLEQIVNKSTRVFVTSTNNKFIILYPRKYTYSDLENMGITNIKKIQVPPTLQKFRITFYKEDNFRGPFAIFDNNALVENIDNNDTRSHNVIVKDIETTVDKFNVNMSTTTEGNIDVVNISPFTNGGCKSIELKLLNNVEAFDGEYNLSNNINAFNDKSDLQYLILFLLLLLFLYISVQQN